MKLIRNVILSALLTSAFLGCSKEIATIERPAKEENSLVLVLETKANATLIATDQEREIVGDLITIYRFPYQADGMGRLKDIQERVIATNESGEKQLVFENLEVGVYYNYYLVANIAGNATSALGTGNLPSNITEKEFLELQTDQLTSASSPLGSPLLISGKTVAPMADRGRTKVVLNRAVARFDIESHLVNAEIVRVLISSARSKGFIFKDNSGQQPITQRYSMEIPVTTVIENGVNVAIGAFYLYPTTLDGDTSIALEVKHTVSGERSLLHLVGIKYPQVKINSRYSLVIDDTVVITP